MRSFLSICALLCVTASVNAQLIIVTDQKHPVVNIPQEARVITLDASENLYNPLSANLLHTAAQAERMAKQRLQELGSPYQHAMQEALQGVIDAWSPWYN